MPPVTTKHYKNPDRVLLFRDETTTPGSTTVDGAVAKGATQITVLDATNFAVGDAIRVGSGELQELCTIQLITVLDIDLDRPLQKGHEDGAAVFEQIPFDIGDVTDAGVVANYIQASTDFNVATKRLTFITLKGFIDSDMTFAVPGLALPSFLHATGSLLSEQTGAGTLASPDQVVTDGNEFGDEVNMNLAVEGVLEDGTFWMHEMWGVQMDYTQINAQLSQGALANMNMRAVAGAGGIVTTATSPYTADLTIRPSKGKVFQRLTDLGIWEDDDVTPVSTTTDAANSKGAVVLNVALETGFVAGDWIRVSTGDTVEFHWVDSTAAGVLNLRTRLLRDIAIGAAVVQQKETALGGVTEDGVTLTVGGNIEVKHIGTSIQSVGLRLGNASVALAFAITQMTKENLARALGIPQADIVGANVPILDNIGTEAIEGLFVRGTLEDGTIAHVNAWGISQDLAAWAITYNNAGTQPNFPFNGKPASGLQLLQYN